jgi:hypothetical protein
MMTKRGVVLHLSHEIAEAIRFGKIRLPDGMHIERSQDDIEHNRVLALVRGDLPSWAETTEGAAYPLGKLVEQLPESPGRPAMVRLEKA